MFFHPFPFGYLWKLSQNMKLFDLWIMFSKAFFSGLFISLICCFHGLKVRHSFTEVPQRNIKAFAQSAFFNVFYKFYWDNVLLGIFGMSLKLKDLTIKNRRPDFKSINFTFEYGKIYFCHGAHGIGKSSLVNSLVGLSTLWKGK